MKEMEKTLQIGLDETRDILGISSDRLSDHTDIHEMSRVSSHILWISMRHHVDYCAHWRC